MAIGTGAPVVTSIYYSGQGRCLMGTRDTVTGKPLGLVTVGNVPELTIGIEETKEEHKESWSGQRAIDDTLVTETKVNVTIAFESLSPANIALGLKATVTTEASATLVPQAIKLYKGKWTLLNHLKVSDFAFSVTNPDIGDLTVEDLVLDADGGMVQLAEAYAGTYVEGDDINVTYSHAAQIDVQGLTNSANAERYFVFRGLNTKSGKQVRLEIPRLEIAPFTELGKINDTIASVSVTASALADPLITTVGQSQFFSEKYES